MSKKIKANATNIINFEVENLSPEGFESFCKKLATQWAEENLKQKEYKIYYRRHEPIDIVITERNPNTILLGQIIADNQKQEYEHFIECKFYKGNLGLEVLGKTYLMTLRYKPKTLVIATNVALTERAINFADWLTGQLSDFACSIWNPFSDSQLVSKIEGNNSEITYEQKHIKSFKIENWSLFEENVFNRPLIASNSETGNKKIYVVRPDNKFSFECKVQVNSPNRLTIKTNLLLQTDNGYTIIQSLEFSKGLNDRLIISGSIKEINSNEELEFTKTFLVLESSSGEDILPVINFPILITSPESFYLPDLRVGEANKLFDKLCKDTNLPLVMISGEGGIGKTFLCEKVCSLAKDNGFHVAHTPLSLDSEPAFINELIWLLLPEELRSTLQSEEYSEFTTEFLQIFFDHFEQDQNQNECFALRDLLTFNKWKESDPELIMSILARVIASSSNRIILVLSNCHRISNACAQILQAFISSLESLDWAYGKVKIIMEYRDTKEDATYQWLKLNDWLIFNFSERVQLQKLTSLTSKELEETINEFIVSSENNLATDLIIKKTGGNPLYIKMLLQSLIEYKILQPICFTNNHYSYSLYSLADLRDFIVELSTNVESILIKRINYWHNKLIEQGNISGGYLLGFGSLINLDLSIILLSNITSQSREKTELALLKLQNAGLVERINEDRFRFSHEYITSSAEQWIKIQDDKYERIIQASNHCHILDFESAFARGQLEAYIMRKQSAIDSYNAALQFSKGIFSKMFLCHKEILNVLGTRNIDLQHVNLFFTNLKQIVRIGEYIASCKELVGYNKIGIKALKQFSLLDNEKQPFFRQYYHNLAHVSLKTIRIDDYFTFAEHSLKFCKTNLEFAQFLNRFVKCAVLLGFLDAGRQLTILALRIQQKFNQHEDQDLESVILGEAYMLYAYISVTHSEKIADKLAHCKGSNRQLSHNLYIEARSKILSGKIEEAKVLVQKLNLIIQQGDLFSMKTFLLCLNGLLDIIDKNDYEEALEKFKKAKIDAAWMDWAREEIQFGNNLLVTLISTGKFDQASYQYKRLMILCRRINEGNYHSTFHKLLQIAEDRIQSHIDLPELSNAYFELLPEISTFSANVSTAVLINAFNINRAFPDFFDCPSNYGIDIAKIKDNCDQQNVIPISVNALDNTLYLIV